MPSPFPGMDPYLERPSLFPDFHDSLITYLREAMQANLPSAYYAGIGRRTWLEFAERTIGPDVELLLNSAARENRKRNLAVAERGREPVVVYDPHDEVVEPLVEIYVGKGRSRRLVTAIEVLSPKNKEAGDYGRTLYQRKQQEIVKHSQVHLVEIDLLRGGEHTIAVSPAAMHAAVQDGDYRICTHRYHDSGRYLIHSVSLEEPLPEIRVPLLPNDGEVPVNLQAIFDRTYDAGPYRREIDYAHDPLDPPLPPERMEWVRQRIATEQT